MPFFKMHLHGVARKSMCLLLCTHKIQRAVKTLCVSKYIALCVKRNCIQMLLIELVHPLKEIKHLLACNSEVDRVQQLITKLKAGESNA